MASQAWSFASLPRLTRSTRRGGATLWSTAWGLWRRVAVCASTHTRSSSGATARRKQNLFTGSWPSGWAPLQMRHQAAARFRPPPQTARPSKTTFPVQMSAGGSGICTILHGTRTPRGGMSASRPPVESPSSGGVGWPVRRISGHLRRRAFPGCGRAGTERRNSSSLSSWSRLAVTTRSYLDPPWRSATVAMT